MVCYLEDCWARVGTWAGRICWRGVPRHCDANGTTGDCLGLTVRSSIVLGVLLSRILFLLCKCRKPCDSYVWVRQESEVGNQV
jgi:hypothetical protein